MQHDHPHARLTTHGRARLLHSVASGTPVADACADAGVSRTTYYHWRQRFASEGLPGLAEPHGQRFPVTCLALDAKRALCSLSLGDA